VAKRTLYIATWVHFCSTTRLYRTEEGTTYNKKNAKMFPSKAKALASIKDVFAEPRTKQAIQA
jgi:hypothetical protein